MIKKLKFFTKVKWVFFLFLFPIHKAVAENTTSIWFAPNHYEFLQKYKNVELLTKYKVNVFQFYGGYILRESDQNLNKIFKYLKRNNIAVSIELPMITWSKDYGYHTEGFAAEGYVASVIKKIKRNGGEVNYISMDEPLFAWYKKHNKKLSSRDIESLAIQINKNTRFIYNEYPNILIGDVEPINQLGYDKIKKLSEFYDAYQSKTKHKLHFIHLDISWGERWADDVIQFTELARLLSLRSGVILNSQNTKGPDNVWITNAQENISNFKKHIRSPLNDSIFQSWSKYPYKIIPGHNKEGHLSLIKELSDNSQH